MPILQYNKRSTGANAYKDMTIEIIENNIIKNNTEFDMMAKRAVTFWDSRNKKKQPDPRKRPFWV
jgi:hypothetical protein